MDPEAAPQHAHEWSNSFWDCCSPAGTCMLGFFCPCFLYGKTSSRVKSPSSKEYSYVNGDAIQIQCCLWVVAGHFYLSWVPLMMRRAEIRERFGIDGSGFKDCMVAYWCPCCALVQQEKEMEMQFSRTQEGYQAPADMSYPQ